MSAIFNGTNAYLETATSVIGSPSYPILMGAWVKSNNVTATMNVVNISDNAAIGTLDCMGAFLAGASAGDPSLAQIGAAGGFGYATQNGCLADVWIWVGVVLRGTGNRSAILNQLVGTADFTALTVAGLALSTIGAQKFNSGGTVDSYFDGKIAEAFFASGFTIGDLSTILSQIISYAAPPDITELEPYIQAYQPLRRGLNDAGYIGATWTNNNVTFDGGDDHPVPLPSVLDELIDGTYTLRNYIEAIGATAAGKRTGGVHRNLEDTKDVVDGTVSGGDRTAVTYDFS